MSDVALFVLISLRKHTRFYYYYIYPTTLPPPAQAYPSTRMDLTPPSPTSTQVLRRSPYEHDFSRGL